jgi:hypothetical protein
MVRIWRCPVSVLDRQHLLGEHFELHIIVNALLRKRKGINAGWQNHPQTLRFDSEKGFGQLLERHRQQVAEFEKRGYHDRKPLPEEIFNFKRAGYSLGDGYNSNEMEEDILTLLFRKGTLLRR